METWKDIPGYEGSYQVSDLGNVRSLDRFVPARGGSTRKAKGRPMKPHTNHGGYLRLQLHSEGSWSSQFVHRLVMLAFVGPPPKGMEVCHGLLGPQNNTLGNMRYGTRSDNTQDKFRDDTIPGMKIVRSDGVVYPSQGKAAAEMGGCQTSIGRAVKKQGHVYKGYTWRRA